MINVIIIIIIIIIIIWIVRCCWFPSPTPLNSSKTRGVIALVSKHACHASVCHIVLCCHITCPEIVSHGTT